jgi:hypothetical protein
LSVRALKIPNPEAFLIDLRYLTLDQKTFKCGLIALLAIHASILRIFDDCLDGSFFADGGWKALWSDLEAKVTR